MRLFYDIIADKRDGKRLCAADIDYFLDSYLSGRLTDYQMSAMLMAIFFRGLDEDELSAWAGKMLFSGQVMDFKELGGIVIDKHSTGGVGDKISIPLAPVLAALGFKVPMISGRGLGHTGGTLDKLESIPGFNVNLDMDTFRRQMREVSVSLIGQTPQIAPLDKKLYSLRDVTGTVESIPLIASSIMSKKLAEGIDGLMLDVKVGNGAFMKDFRSARKLAKTMISIGKKFGKKVTVVFSNMNEPLGMKVGNSLEIEESVDALRGKYVPQVSELTEQMAAKLLKTFGLAPDMKKGVQMARGVIADGSAYNKFIEIVKFQGGNPDSITNTALLPQAEMRKEVKAETSGIIDGIDALRMGKALVFLGGGRIKKEDSVDPAVGFILNKKAGDKVEKGELLYTILYNDAKKLESASEYLEGIFSIPAAGDQPAKEELILGWL